MSVQFGAGLLPASLLGAHWSSRSAAGSQRRAFGRFLVAFGVAFTLYRLVTA